MARKRKSGPRTKSGQVSRAYKSNPTLRDHGTPEAQAKRLALVGQNADPALSATMPGILYARRTELFREGEYELDHYTEALEYRRLRCSLYGPPWPTNVVGGAASDERLAKLRERFDRMCGRLSQIQKLVLSNVCVYDQEPMWLWRVNAGLRLRFIDKFEKDCLIKGLGALVSGGTVDERPQDVVSHDMRKSA
jgi:hypothetical protein